MQMRPDQFQRQCLYDTEESQQYGGKMFFARVRMEFTAVPRDCRESV